MVTVSGKDPDEMARLVEGVAYLNTRHALTHTIYNSSKFIFRSGGGKSMRKVTESAQNQLCSKRKSHLMEVKSNCLPKTAN